MRTTKDQGKTETMQEAKEKKKSHTLARMIALKMSIHTKR